MPQKPGPRDNSNATIEEGQKPYESAQQPPPPFGVPSGEDERPAPPSSITGAFLACGLLLEASDELPTAQIGCLMNDANRARIDPLKLGANATYKIEGIPASATLVQRVPTNPIRNFDAIWDLSAPNKAAVQDALNKALFKVEFKGVLNGEPLGIQTSSLEQVLVEAKRGDWASFLSNASPTYVDLNTSLTWALDDGKGYTLAEGSTHCNDLIYAGASTWRLPTISELQTAHLNGLGVAYADSGNMNVDSNRFGGYGASTLEFPNQPPVIGQSRRWVINLTLPAGQNTTLNPIENRFSVICVHE